MHAWRDDISSFFRAVRDGGLLPEGMGTGNRYSLADALGIYRNNYRENLLGALEAAYPVVEQIVGAAFFRRMAQEYIDCHPSRSGNLHDYGGELPAFLADMASLHRLPYLADVARLDWACHLAYFAPDSAAIDVVRLQKVSPELLPELRWTCHPACCVLHSPYPLFDIWQSHQPGAPEDFRIDLDSGGGHVLVSRRHNSVEVSFLPLASAVWLSRIQAGESLGTATGAALAIQPDFDLSAILSKLVERAVLTDLELVRE